MPQQLAWLLPSLGVLALLASSVMFLAASRAKETIAGLERNNKLLSERVGLLEASDLRKSAEIEGLQAAKDVLTRTVNSADILAEMQRKSDERHTETIAALAAIMSALKTIQEGKP